MGVKVHLSGFSLLGCLVALTASGCLQGDTALRVSDPSGGGEVPPLTVQGISSSAVPVTSKTWYFTCSTIPCRFRSLINTNATHVFSLESYGALVNESSATQASGSGTYYLHVQAKDASGNESVVKTVSAYLDDEAETFNLSGSVVFDWVPAVKVGAENTYGFAEGKLNYSGKTALPGRRLLVQALRSSDSSVLASTSTDDSGHYELTVPQGESVKVRLNARMLATSYAKDGVAGSLESCSGASWDVRVVDNTRNRALYVLTSSSSFSSATTGVNFHPAVVFNSGSKTYTTRDAAPFALLDTIVRELELVCQSNPSQSFPALYVNWSSANVDTPPRSDTDSDGDGIGDDQEQGLIATSHYTNERIGGVYQPVMYILGKDGEDTDEYDDHVVAHEFGHYLEDQLYRSDSIGGSHGIGDVLDARVAFGEGFGNAISGMTFGNPVYVDSSGEGQASGFSMNVSTAPVSKWRSVYSEQAVQSLLYSLFSSRSSSYDRIHTVLASDQKTSPALTSLHSFVSYYRSRYGADADGLSTLWTGTAGSSFNSLCQGACASDASTRDLFDGDGDLGTGYFSSSLEYPAPVSGSGSLKNAGFWQLYTELVSGSNSSTHNQTDRGDYVYPDNKAGMNRWYHYRPSSSGTKQISVSSVSGVSGLNCSTTANAVDALDLYVYQQGSLIRYDISSSGCPSVSFTATAGTDYVVVVGGYEGEASAYTLTVSP